MAERYAKPGPKVKNSARCGKGDGRAGHDGNSPLFGTSSEHTGHVAKSGNGSSKNDSMIRSPASGRGVLGGARERHAGSACSGHRFRWRRIFSITLLSSINAMTFISAPQCGQMSGSTSHTFLINSRHFFAGMRGGRYSVNVLTSPT